MLEFGKVEEIEWVQSGVVGSRDRCAPPSRRRLHFRQRARRERHLEKKFGLAVQRLSASSGVPQTTRISSVSGLLRPRPSDGVVLHREPFRVSFEVLPASGPITATPSLVIERRFMARVEHRIRPRKSGCPVMRSQRLPILCWFPSRTMMNRLQHAVSGNIDCDAEIPPTVSQTVKRRSEYSDAQFQVPRAPDSLT